MAERALEQLFSEGLGVVQVTRDGGSRGAALTEQEPAICTGFARLPAWSLGGRLSGWRIGGKRGLWKPATSWTAVVSVGHITERLPCASWSTGRVCSESRGYAAYRATGFGALCAAMACPRRG